MPSSKEIIVRKFKKENYAILIKLAEFMVHPPDSTTFQPNIMG